MPTAFPIETISKFAPGPTSSPERKEAAPEPERRLSSLPRSGEGSSRRGVGAPRRAMTLARLVADAANAPASYLDDLVAGRGGE